MNIGELANHIDADTLARVRVILSTGEGSQKAFSTKNGESKYAAIWERRLLCPPSYRRAVLIRWQENSAGMLCRPEFEVTYL